MGGDEVGGLIGPTLHTSLVAIDHPVACRKAFECKMKMTFKLLKKS